MQLRLYAKYPSDDIIFPDVFEGSTVSVDEQRDTFIDVLGAKLFFSFVLVLPIIVYLLFLCFTKGARTRINVFLKKSDHYSSQAAIVCVGQAFTLYFIIMDIIALSTKGLVEYMTVIIFLLFFVELGLFLFILVFAILFCCNFGCSTCFLNVFKWICYPALHKLESKDVKSWFVVVAFVPLLVCLSSHIGFIIEGWASLATRGTAIMLFHSLCFIYLFLVFQEMYSMLADCKICKSKDEQCEPGLNFRILVFELTGGLLLVGIVLLYVVFGFTNFPVLRGIEEVFTRVYDFNHTVALFTIFLFTYILIYKRRQRSDGLISENVIKYWKILHTKSPPKQEDLRTDADKADALIAVLLFHHIQPQQGNVSHYKTLLSQIVAEKGDRERQRESEVQEGSEGTGSGAGNEERDGEREQATGGGAENGERKREKEQAEEDTEPLLGESNV